MRFRPSSGSKSWSFVASTHNSASSPCLTWLAGSSRATMRPSPALGDLPIGDRVRRQLEDADAPKELIVGIRPEHFEDASLVGDKPGGMFDAPIDIVEAMGSDVFAYFTVKGQEAHSADLDDLAKDTGNDMTGVEGVPVTARLDAASHVQRGKTARLWYDTSKVAVFDAETGVNLAPGGADVTDSSGAQSSSGSSGSSSGSHRS